MASYAIPSTEAPRLKRGEKDRLTRKNNVFAWTGLLLSLIAFFFNPFALASIIAIVFSSIGLARAQRLSDAGVRIAGRGTAIAGLVIGIAGVALFLYSVSRMFPALHM
jgi:hypothetical protein